MRATFKRQMTLINFCQQQSAVLLLNWKHLEPDTCVDSQLCLCEKIFIRCKTHGSVLCFSAIVELGKQAGAWLMDVNN